MNNSGDIAEVFAASLRELQPPTLLAVGANAAMIAELCAACSPTTAVSAFADADRRPTDERYAVAIVSGALEAIPRREGQALLARLRDLECDSLIVSLEIRAGGEQVWRENDLLALGMKRLGRTQRENSQFVIYDFALSDYKPTPRWFNRQHWANPDMWDKFRW